MRALGNNRLDGAALGQAVPQFDAARPTVIDDVPADFDWSDSENEA